MFSNVIKDNKLVKEPPYLYDTRPDLYDTRPEKNEIWKKSSSSLEEYVRFRPKTQDWHQSFSHFGSEGEDIQIKIKSKRIMLPIGLSKLAKAIEESLYILELEANFDDEGSVEYDFATWERTIDFLVNYAKWALDAYNTIIETPNIYHGPDGSIDLLWKNQIYKLLINVPREIEKPASFYGDDYNMDVIKGTFDPSKCNRGLLMLLLKSK